MNRNQARCLVSIFLGAVHYSCSGPVTLPQGDPADDLWLDYGAYQLSSSMGVSSQSSSSHEAQSSSVQTSSSTLESLAFSMTVKAMGGQYYLSHNACLNAFWITNAKGEYVRTVGIYTQWYQYNLVNWNQALPGSDPTLDGVTGATQSPGARNFQWDLMDYQGSKVAFGDYVLHMETVEDPLTPDNTTYSVPFSLTLPFVPIENTSHGIFTDIFISSVP